MLIILKNRRTGKQLTLTLEKFKEKFKVELFRAYQSYKRHEDERMAFLPDFMRKNVTEADFMLCLAWNFNNYSGSDWYIFAIR